ncbi:MAG TPA: hypothetical protein VIV58_37710 [Kofleriaceae bacterium]
MSTYLDRMFDPRFTQDREWRQREDIDRASGQIDSLDAHVMRLEGQVHDLSLTVMSLIEILTEDGKLTLQDVKARVQAASIGERHARTETARSDDATDAWDALKR